LDASVIKAANGSTYRPIARCTAEDARAACAVSLTRIDDTKVATMHLSAREIARLPSCSRPSRVKRYRARLAAALDCRYARRRLRTWSGRRNGAAFDRTAE
jgi:hypothetical protein